MHRRHAPGTGGGLRHLLLSYARQIGLSSLFQGAALVADVFAQELATLLRLIAALSSRRSQVLGLIDFYHAAKLRSDESQGFAAGARSIRIGWLNRTRGLGSSEIGWTR